MKLQEPLRTNGKCQSLNHFALTSQYSLKCTVCPLVQLTTTLPNMYLSIVFASVVTLSQGNVARCGSFIESVREAELQNKLV